MTRNSANGSRGEPRHGHRSLSTWDGYAATLTADAALRAVDSGRLEQIRMREKPALYGPPSPPLRDWATRSYERTNNVLNGEKLIDRPLRWGMIGGGRTGPGRLQAPDRRAARRHPYRLVCGAFDLDAERGRDFGQNLGVDEDRLYPTTRS